MSQLNPVQVLHRGIFLCFLKAHSTVSNSRTTWSHLPEIRDFKGGSTRQTTFRVNISAGHIKNRAKEEDTFSCSRLICENKVLHTQQKKEIPNICTTLVILLVRGGSFSWRLKVNHITKHLTLFKYSIWSKNNKKTFRRGSHSCWLFELNSWQSS